MNVEQLYARSEILACKNVAKYGVLKLDSGNRLVHSRKRFYLEINWIQNYASATQRNKKLNARKPFAYKII